MLRETRPIEFAPALAPDLEDALEIVYAGRGGGTVTLIHLFERGGVSARKRLKERAEACEITSYRSIVVVVVRQRGRGANHSSIGHEQCLSRKHMS